MVVNTYINIYPCPMGKSQHKKTIEQYYKIIDNALIISKDFNQSVKPLYPIIRQYNILKFECDGNSSLFSCSIILTPNLTHVYFGAHFNHSLELTPNIICLSLGARFNHPLVLTPCITHLTLGTNFNNILILNKYLTHLKMNYSFDKHRLFLSKHMKKILFSDDYHHPIVFTKYLSLCVYAPSVYPPSPIILTKNIKSAFFSFLNTNTLNKNIVHLTILNQHRKLNGLNKNLKHLIIFEHANPLPNITKNIKTLSVMSLKYPLVLEYPLENIYVDNSTNCCIIDGLPNKTIQKIPAPSCKNKIFCNIPNDVKIENVRYTVDFLLYERKGIYYKITHDFSHNNNRKHTQHSKWHKMKIKEKITNGITLCDK